MQQLKPRTAGNVGELCENPKLNGSHHFTVHCIISGVFVVGAQASWFLCE
jgi:hypothetical protein